MEWDAVLAMIWCSPFWRWDCVNSEAQAAWISKCHQKWCLWPVVLTSTWSLKMFNKGSPATQSKPPIFRIWEWHSKASTRKLGLRLLAGCIWILWCMFPRECMHAITGTPIQAPTYSVLWKFMHPTSLEQSWILNLCGRGNKLAGQLSCVRRHCIFTYSKRRSARMSKYTYVHTII